ncbi:nitrite reductase, copper-containing [Haloplanus aerogenes]|uniref:Copper-containing nitrite reductase n=1 Tax=Haloplanus aerogenes TaxID=660522 RepID=A0A3G8QZK6_9EURY|nr:nitrite reductase, copper-containing [Haloplanus aerogenes]RMB13401.1 dissimilatory nitrite reductase (NO-forming) copper type apoprotein [Haloplanus aerogenes]
MSSVPATTRRRVLQALGATGATAVAGCLGAPRADSVAAETAPRSPAMNPARQLDVDRIAANPTAIPPPIDRDDPETVRVELTTRELVAEVEPGVTYTFMTFDGRVPGPLIRARVGDHVEMTVTSDPSNSMPHNVDLHAVRGPGGGAEASMVSPGETKTFTFKATYPGLFVYHCAVPNLDYHISSGMFGAILIEPEEGLPAVDHEFYLGQHELYTAGDAGEQGHHDFDFEAMAAEEPTYVLINGEKYGIGPDGYNEMQMGTDETARIYYAVGGPNFLSSFHPIGSVWDEVYPQGGIGSDVHRNVQTTPVLPGSTTIATLHTPVPGPIKLVDHALSRVARKGALAVIDVQGPANPDVFDAGEEAAAAASTQPAGDFDGWFDDVENYDGPVDRTGEDEVTVQVGSQANGGGFGYGPAAVSVSPGTTVRWEWTGEGGSHDVRADGGSFASQMTADAGHTFAQTFDAPGTTKYYCMPHKAMGMKGAVVVG